MEEGEVLYEPRYFGVSPDEVGEISEPEIVFDFIKPHILSGTAPVIQGEFRGGIVGRGGSFAVLAYGRTPQLPEEFWWGHYGYLIDKYKDTALEKAVNEIVPKMIKDFSSRYGRGLWWEVLLGTVGLHETSRNVLGDKLNPAPGTIRADYMIPSGEPYDTVMHVSDFNKVRRELENFAEKGIKDDGFDELLEGLDF